MALQVYNTLSRSKEPFEPVQPGKVRIYTCGLTVQDYCHVGHARMDMIWDCIKNWLRERGYEVYHLQNFTDLNEKIAAKALAAGVAPLEWANTYAQAYLDDMQALGVQGPDRYVRVSEEMPAIIALIERLLQGGHAYLSEGNVYFRVDSYSRYGRLSGRRTEELQAGSRAAITTGKENPEDFALWTEVQPGEPQWESPWGPGTPGWHIECSAMSMHYLGAHYDMHGGGVDILFPHHENELAQSCAALEGEPEDYAKYWVHHGMVVNQDGTKMSKSLNNFYRVRDILKQYPAWALRFFILSTHYRSPVSFSPELVAASAQAFGRLQRLAGALREVHSEVEEDPSLRQALSDARERFGEAMDDDFNTAAAIAVLFELTRELNTALQENRLSKGLADEALQQYLHWGAILGIAAGFESQPEGDVIPTLDDEIAALVEARTVARAGKDWAKADAIRKELDERGIVLVDTPQGVTWKRK